MIDKARAFCFNGGFRHRGGPYLKGKTMIAISVVDAFKDLWHDYPGFFIAGIFVIVALVLVFPYAAGKSIAHSEDYRYGTFIIVVCGIISMVLVNIFDHLSKGKYWC